MPKQIDVSTVIGHGNGKTGGAYPNPTGKPAGNVHGKPAAPSK